MSVETAMANEELVVVDSEPLLPQERRNNTGRIFFKFIAVVLLVGAACHLFVSNFDSWTWKTEEVPSDTDAEVCDLSVGRWIPNSAEPQYTNKTCSLMASYTNCMKNGRPDSAYLHWRWKPNGCDLPLFDPLKFLTAMRNKSWAFIGDSIFRNHVRSFLCLLNKVEEPQLLYHDKTNTGIWYFPSYNLTIYDIWSPFLIRNEDPFGERRIDLDVLDSKWTDWYNRYDYVVLSGSAWFYKSTTIYEHNKVIGCHYCPDSELREYGADNAYRKALQLTFKFIATSENKPFVMLRTWSPSHYEDGEFPGQRICDRTMPYKEGEINGDHTDLQMMSIEIEEFGKAKAIVARNGVKMKLLDTYHLSLLRPDGHPGAYRNYHPFDGGVKNVENDCLHWCLPGPIDTWNDLIMKIVLN